MIEPLKSTLSLINTQFTHLQEAFLLVVRLYWGYLFAIAGWGKLWNLGGVSGFFTDLGIPLPFYNAILAANVEFFGGVLLALGLLSRIITIPLAFTMLVAFYTAHFDDLTSIFSEPGDFLGASPFTYLLASLIIFVFGPGRLSIDGLINKGRFRETSA